MISSQLGMAARPLPDLARLARTSAGAPAWQRLGGLLRDRGRGRLPWRRRPAGPPRATAPRTAPRPRRGPGRRPRGSSWTPAPATRPPRAPGERVGAAGRRGARWPGWPSSRRRPSVARGGRVARRRPDAGAGGRLRQVGQVDGDLVRLGRGLDGASGGASGAGAAGPRRGSGACGRVDDRLVAVQQGVDGVRRTAQRRGARRPTARVGGVGSTTRSTGGAGRRPVTSSMASSPRCSWEAPEPCPSPGRR